MSIEINTYFSGKVSLEFIEDVMEILDTIFFIKFDAFFFVFFQTFFSVFLVYLDATIGIDDAVEGDIFLAIAPGFTEDTGDAL